MYNDIKVDGLISQDHYPLCLLYNVLQCTILDTALHTILYTVLYIKLYTKFTVAGQTGLFFEVLNTKLYSVMNTEL